MLIKYLIAFFAVSILIFVYLSSNSEGSREDTQPIELEVEASDYKDLTSESLENAANTLEATGSKPLTKKTDISDGYSNSRELTDEDLVQIRKLRSLIDFGSVEEAINAIVKGEVLINSLTPSARNLIEEILTPITTPEQFDYLININVIDASDANNYYETIFVRDAPHSEDWALEKFKILEQYGTDISQLKRKVSFRNSTYEVAPLEKAAALGMSSVVEYFISRSTSYRNSEIAWYGILVEQRGDYLGTAEALLSAGYGPAPRKLNDILNEEFESSHPHLFNLLEEFQLRQDLNQ